MSAHVGDSADESGVPPRRLNSPAWRPRVKLWVERAGEVALSDWRVALLEAVDATGSLSAAARQVNVPYRTAWHKLRQIEASLGLKLLETHSGGAEGGRSQLTPNARALIAAFRDFGQGVQELIEERFDRYFEGIDYEPAPVVSEPPSPAQTE